MAENPEFLKALHKMMKALPLIAKDEKAFKYKYATLESIIEQWEPVFEEHGFMLRQFTESGRNGDWDVVITKLTHLKTGESEEYSLTVPVGTDWQHTGAGVTYFKRYTLTLLKHPVGEDFDGLKTEAELKGAKAKPPKAKANGSATTNKAAEDEETGAHIAYEEFLKDCKDVVSLEKFYTENKRELDKMKGGYPDQYAKCIDAFKSRKQELQNGK